MSISALAIKKVILPSNKYAMFSELFSSELPKYSEDGILVSKDKIEIAKHYLVPVIESSMKFETGQIIIEDETYQIIIEQYTGDEKGVRNLKRCLETIYSKLNMYRFLKSDTELYKEERISVKFPYHLTSDNLSIFLKREDELYYVRHLMYT